MLRRSPLQTCDRATNILPFRQLENRATITVDAQYKAMFDISRIFAIPELEPDKLQMGLSNTSWAIVAATGKTKDGSPAKASVLKQERKGVSQQDIKKAEKVGIKGDRALNSEPRIVKNNVNTKDLIAVKIDGKSVSVPSGSEFVAVKDNHIQSQIVGQRAYRVAPKNGTQDDYIRETAQGQSAPVVKFKTSEQALKYAEKLNKAVGKKQKESPKPETSNPSSRKLTPEIAAKAKFNQPKPSAKIAPDTAKKVKRAIAGVKGGKVVKGQMPITGRVVESGKTGKDGFTKSTISIPLHSYNAKGVKISEPTKGERIGNYHVSKDGGRDSGYSITHIPSGTMVLNANVLKGELGSNDKETAKRAAKKLHEAQIPMPKTFQGLKKLQTTKMRPKMQEIGRKVLSSIK